jgi:hypothetical protein
MIPVCEPVGRDDSAPPAQPSRFSPRLQIAAAACACAGASTFLFLVDPNRHSVYPSCLLFRATGIYCAGCGATRALYALLHGDILRAIHDNALFVGALPFIAGFLGVYLWQAWRENAWPDRTLEPRSLVRNGAGIFLLMLVFMALRNIPGAPFDLLRPV